VWLREIGAGYGFNPEIHPALSERRDPPRREAMKSAQISGAVRCQLGFRLDLTCANNQTEALR